MRLITTHLLVAVLLVCPYFCLLENLGESAGATEAPQQAAACCCDSNERRPGGEAPPPSDEKEPDCLCHGAIMDSLRSAEVDVAAPLVIGWLIDDAAPPSTEFSLSAISFEPPHQFPPFSTGRDICALTCALLI